MAAPSGVPRFGQSCPEVACGLPLVETDASPIAYLTRMTAYLSDLLHAARTLSRARAFTAVCVVSLGLGTAVAGVLGLVALAGCAMPAWRVTRVDPLTVLRMD
jgi:hypothetical protein